MSSQRRESEEFRRAGSGVESLRRPPLCRRLSMDSQGQRVWGREEVRRAINERFLLLRELEKTGFRRLLFASAAFIGA